MFHVLLIFTIAIGVGLGAGPQNAGSQNATDRNMSAVTDADTNSGSLLDGTNTTLPEDTNRSLLDGTESGTAYGAADADATDWQPEPQEPTGKFTTATEVKPILTATKTAWVAVREYDGNDLLYFTHLVAWRCGLHEIRYGVNGAAEQVFEVEECYINTAQPNAMKMETHFPYVILDIGSVENMSVTLIFDDGTKDSATYQRSDILMP